jgi:hypothetical protein
MTVHNPLDPYKECILDWSISPAKRVRLNVYQLLHWERDYFFNKSVGGIIGHDGYIYTVQYYNTQPSELFKFKEVILSFRKLASLDRGWVLVRPKLGTEIV